MFQGSGTLPTVCVQKTGLNAVSDLKLWVIPPHNFLVEGISVKDK